MPSQAKQEADFIWRPSDNSVQTTHKYDREAEKWYLSYQAAIKKHNGKPFQESMTVIGLVLSLVLNIIWVVGLLLVKFLNWLNKQLGV